MGSIIKEALKKPYDKPCTLDRKGTRFLNRATGSGDTDTGRRLWDSIKNDTIADALSGHRVSYEKFAPQELHTQSKAKNLHILEDMTACFGIFWPGYGGRSAIQKAKDRLEYSAMLIMQMERGYRIYVLLTMPSKKSNVFKQLRHGHSQA